MIFIDTGAFLARYVQHDQYHHKAVAGWKRLAQTGRRCLTSNLVLSETLTLLTRRTGARFAAERARHILSSELLTILRPSAQEEWDAIEALEKYADQAISFTDAVSFVLMRQHGLKEVFSFDSHFERAGFRLWG